jgi:acetolactate synthase I/II/III large subunit
VADSNERPNGAVGRRDFFKGAAAGAAGMIVTGREADAAPASAVDPPAPAVVVPTVAQDQAYALAQSGATPPVAGAVPNGRQPASDFMVDVLKKLDFDYVAINPGSAFAGLHESLINYSGNRAPEILTALHEEAAIAMAHGYAKAAGKPMLVCVHGTVGMLHGSMALFQAWADRVPVFLIVGLHRNPTGIVNLPHSAQDMGSIVRDFVKFDDEATNLERFAESTLRAYQIATTPPTGPVLLSVDADLQEEIIDAKERPRIPELVRTSPPQGDSNAVREAARLLVAAESPLLLPRKLARTPRGWDLMIELAQTLQAPVDVGTYGSWQDFPSWHPLWGNGGAGYRADVTLGLEMSDMSALARTARTNGRKTISISAEHLFQHSNIHDYGRYADVDLAIAGDAEATLPSLIEEVKKLLTDDRKRALADRGTKIAAAHKDAHKRYVENASFGWGNSPISIPRMIAELGEQVKNDDWAIVSGHQFTGDWQRRLMNFDKHYRYNGDNGGFGIGYDTPGSVGAALAHKRQGRLSIGIVGDGDLNFQPGVLWTAVHHKIPLLLVVHNNRAYHAEVMIVQRMCGSRGRGMANAHIGSMLNEPAINYSQMAKAYGMYSEGPIDNPRDLAAAYQRALAKVRAGEPALIDVVAQPR